jgi:hypothetical protein
MPFRSARQRRKMFADPKLRHIAKRWAKKYGTRVRRKKKRRARK